MIKTRKAQLQSNVLTYVIVGILIFIFLIWGIKAISDFNQRQNEILVKQFGVDLRESVASIEYGSVQETNLKLPPDITEVCIADLSKREDVLASPTIGRFPAMKSSIEGGFRKNVFLIKDDHVEESMYGGDICFANYPYHACMDVTQNLLNLFIEGKGRCGLIVRDNQCKTFDATPTAGVTTLVAHDATLTIPKDTTITPAPPPGTETEVCLVATPPPEGVDNEGIISEAYNITPIGTEFNKEITLTIKYYPQMLPTGASSSNILMNYYISNKWEKVPGEPAPNQNKRTITKQGDDFDPTTSYAIFGPRPPTAIIKITGASEPYIFDKSAEIEFDASDSVDNNNAPPLSYEWDFGGDVTFKASTDDEDTKPKVSYDDMGTYTVKLTVTDNDNNQGTKEVQVVIINVDNAKDSTKVDDKVFVISKTEDKKDILKLIPLALYTDESGRKEKPFVVYDGTLTPAEEGKIIKKFGVADLEDGLPSDYYKYWTTFEDIVVVDPAEDKDTMLMAALYATSFNAPLIFDNEEVGISTHTTLKDHLDGGTITLHVIESADTDTLKAEINAITFTVSPTITTKALSANDISGPPKNAFDEAYIETIPSNALP
jgi:PKD repeat protein